MKTTRLLAALCLLAVSAAACGKLPTAPLAETSGPSHERGPTFGSGE